MATISSIINTNFNNKNWRANANPNTNAGTLVLGNTSLANLTLNEQYQFTFSNNVKKINLLQLSEDLLTIACAAYRKHKQDPATYYSLLDDKLFSMITPEDREFSNNIIDYYNKKIMWATLKDKPLTSFRTDLKELINGDRTKVEEKMVRLAYKMPYFYMFDTEFDSIKENFSAVLTNRKHVSSIKPSEVALIPIGKIRRKTKNLDHVQYWMTDEDKNPYLYTIHSTNELRALFEQLFEREEILVTGKFHKSEKDDFSYYTLTNITSMKI